MAKHHAPHQPQQPPTKAPPVVADAPDAPVAVAGVTPFDDQKDELAKAPPVEVPTVAEVKAAGPSWAVAEKIVEEQKALAKAQEKLQAVKAYRISSPLARGFWRAKRHFDRKPVDIPAEKLTEDEVKALVETDPRHLTVEIIKG